MASVDWGLGEDGRRQRHQQCREDGDQDGGDCGAGAPGGGEAGQQGVASPEKKGAAIAARSGGAETGRNRNPAPTGGRRFAWG